MSIKKIRNFLAAGLTVFILAGCGPQPIPAETQERARDNLNRIVAQLDQTESAVQGEGRLLVVNKDRINGVTCWSIGGYPQGISCLPDWMLAAPSSPK